MTLLADIDPMTTCLNNLPLLHQSQIKKIHYYLCNIRGLFGLNYLLQLQPEHIYFFSTENDSIEYLKLLLEIIKWSNTPDEFISHIFCRHPKNLNEYTQYCFLQKNYDPMILKETLSFLTKEGKQRFQHFLSPFLPGQVLLESSSCRRLLPCWPKEQIVPFSFENPRSKNFLGELEPNTNTFFYGNGWLTEKRTYDHIRSLLEHTNICFLLIDIYNDGLPSKLVPYHSSALYLPKLPSSKILDKWKKHLHGGLETLYLLPANEGIQKISL